MDWVSKEFLWAVCGSLLIALIALIAVSWSRPLIQASPPPQVAESVNGAAKADRGGQDFYLSKIRPYMDLTADYCTSVRPNAASEWRKKFICESKITDVVIAILTAFLMIFTGLLVDVGRRQITTTRQQMRAFVYLNDGSIFNVTNPINTLPTYTPTAAELFSPNEGPFANITIKNSGSTPAFGVMHWAGISVADYPLVRELPPRIPSPNIPTSAIPPGGIATKIIRLPSALSQADVTAIRAGAKAIFVYGEIEYVDAFRRKRTTVYRLAHGKFSGAIGISTELTWVEGGNDAT